MAELSKEQIDALVARLADLNTAQMPQGQFIWTDKNGTSYTVQRDKDGNIGFANDGQPIDAKTATSKQNIKTFSDGTTHIVTTGSDGNVTVGDAIAQKAAKVLEGKVEKLGDGWHAVTYDETGKPTVDPQIISPLPGKTLSPGQKLRNGPGGLYSVNDDGSLGPLVAAKPAKEWAPGTADKNKATSGKLDAQTEVILQGAFAGLQQKYAQIDSLVGKPGGPTDQAAADVLKKQVFDQAAQQAATGLTANQAATNETTQRGQDITQGDNRATQATSVFNTAQTTAMDAAKGGAGGAAAAGGFLAMLHAAPGFQASMGGAPMPAAQQPVTDAHKQQIASLVMAGMHFGDAVKKVAADAGVVPPDSGPDPNGSPDPNTPAWGPNSPGAAANPGNFLGALAGS